MDHPYISVHIRPLGTVKIWADGKDTIGKMEKIPSADF